MTTLQEAAQQLIDFHDGPTEAKRHDVFIRRIESLRAALAQQGQEPVAYMDNDGNISDNNDHGTFNTPLYAAPAPQAQPVAAKEPVKLYAGPPDAPPTKKRFFDSNGTEYTLMNGCIANCIFAGFEKLVDRGLAMKITEEPEKVNGITYARMEIVDIEPVAQPHKLSDGDLIDAVANSIKAANNTT